MNAAPTPEGIVEASSPADRPGADPRFHSILSAGYRVIDTLVSGPPAALYLAERVGGGGRLALRVLSDDLAEDSALVRAFREHVALLGCASAVFPGFAAVYECGRTGNGEHFVALEHPSGPTLADVIRRDGALRPERAVRVAFKIAETLEVACKLGVVHGSLRPDNVVLVESDDTVKLTQFGFDWILSSSAPSAPRAGIEGLPYRAPEQASSGQATERSDVYSLGAILYEMLTGVSPSVKESDARATPISPRKLRPGVTEGLERLVMQALETPPERRPNITAFCNDLFAAIDEEGNVATFGPETDGPRSRLLRQMRGLPRVALHFPRAFGSLDSPARALGAAARMWRQPLVGWSGAAASSPRPGRTVRPLAAWGVLAAAVVLVIGGGRLIRTPANTVPVPSPERPIAIAPAVPWETEWPAATATAAGLVPLPEEPAAPQPKSLQPESLGTRAPEIEPTTPPTSIDPGKSESSGAPKALSPSRVQETSSTPRPSARSTARPPGEEVKKVQSVRAAGPRRAETSREEADDPRAVIDWLLKEASGQRR
jgi:serine/threonine-protein kinase